MPKKAGTKTRSTSRTAKADKKVKSKKLRKDEESAEEEEEEEEPKPKRRVANKKNASKTKKKASKKEESDSEVEEEEEEDDVEEKQTAKKRKTNSGKGKTAKVVKSGAPEKILPRSFYARDVFTVSKALLGKVIVRKIGDDVIKCKIVDVEAFAGAIDKASHAYDNKKTTKNEALYLEAGHAYIFTLQQVNNPCLNITTSKKGDPCAAMIRGVEILEGMDIISESRDIRATKSGKEYTNGPGKLCQSLQLDHSLNKHDLTKTGEFYIIEGDGSSFDIVTTKRVKIDYAGEFNNKPWRYCIKGNTFLSAKATPAKEEDDEEEEEDDDE